jgi:hypothetical protein
VIGTRIKGHPTLLVALSRRTYPGGLGRETGATGLEPATSGVTGRAMGPTILHASTRKTPISRHFERLVGRRFLGLPWGFRRFPPHPHPIVSSPAATTNFSDVAARSTVGEDRCVRKRRLFLRIARLDGGDLILDGEGLTRVFFATDPSSVGVGSYDSLAGRGSADRVEVADVVALNRTMRARSPHSSWAGLIGAELSWLRATPPDLDLIETDEARWARLGGDGLVQEAIRSTIGPGRGVSVATKLLHLKRRGCFRCSTRSLRSCSASPTSPTAPCCELTRRLGSSSTSAKKGDGTRTSSVRSKSDSRPRGTSDRSCVSSTPLSGSHIPPPGGPGARRRFTVELLPASPDG